MGLDVYVYRYEDYKKTKAIRDAADKDVDAIYKRDGLSQTDRQREVAAVYERHGYKKHPVSPDGSFEIEYAPGESKLDENSLKHPKHVFRIGYFRSSYNDGGIERALSIAIGISPLSYIFNYDYETSGYEFRPDWDLAKQRVGEVLARYREYRASSRARFNVSTVHTFMPSGQRPTDPGKALDAFMKEEEGHKKSPFGHFSNAVGAFFLGSKPLVVRGIMIGVDALGQPCAYVISDVEKDEDDEGLGDGWYGAALEIVEETINKVLATNESDKYWLHWSA